MSSPTVGSNLGAGWDDLDHFDTAVITPNGVVMNGLGQFTFTKDGLWDLRIQMNFQHNSSNSGRTTNLRLWSVTDSAQVGSDYAVGIGRNVEDTQVSLVPRFPIPEDALGDILVWQIGNGDSITGITYNQLNFSPTKVA